MPLFAPSRDFGRNFLIYWTKMAKFSPFLDPRGGKSTPRPPKMTKIKFFAVKIVWGMLVGAIAAHTKHNNSKNLKYGF